MTAAGALLGALALGVLALVVAGVRTARRPPVVLDRAQALDRWSALHGGYDPRTGSAFLRGWLRLVDAPARPLARAGVHPDVLTWSALVPGALVVLLAEDLPLLAALLVVLSGLVDSLDGAVAVLTGRVSRWGSVLDSAVDRAVDALWLVALVVLGAPAWLAAAAGLAVVELEYVRARSGSAGGDDVGVVTAAERPTRVIVVTAALLAAGAVPSRAAEAGTAGAAVLLAMTAVGVVQVGRALRRGLQG